MTRRCRTSVRGYILPDEESVKNAIRRANIQRGASYGGQVPVIPKDSETPQEATSPATRPQPRSSGATSRPARDSTQEEAPPPALPSQEASLGRLRMPRRHPTSPHWNPPPSFQRIPRDSETPDQPSDQSDPIADDPF